MKVRLTRMTPEMRGCTGVLAVLTLSLLFGLYWGLISQSLFFYGYLVCFTSSMILNHYRSEFIDLDERKLKKLT